MLSVLSVFQGCAVSFVIIGISLMYYQFYHYRFYQFGPDNYVIGLISFVPMTCLAARQERVSHARLFEPREQQSVLKILSTFGDKYPQNGSRNAHGIAFEGPGVATPGTCSSYYEPCARHRSRGTNKHKVQVTRCGNAPRVPGTRNRSRASRPVRGGLVWTQLVTHVQNYNFRRPLRPSFAIIASR